ncbi:hypothetical protein QHF83_38890, partial [Polyangium sp. 15x6]|nr:hypothetical protein [Polyangium sp. 15x6]
GGFGGSGAAGGFGGAGAAGGFGGSGAAGGFGGSGGAGGGNACTEAGGLCVGVAPNACPNGTWLDANTYPCDAGIGVGCCLQLDPIPEQCNTDEECGCGSVCINTQCHSAGGLPPNCTVDADCGQPCLGYVCVAGMCEKPM